MWELIEFNKRQSYLLIAGLALILIILGALIGTLSVAYGNGEVPNVGSAIGIVAAIIIWTVSSMGAWYGGDRMVLGFSKAKPIKHSDYPQLWNVVEEMSIAAGLPMPKVYMIDDSAPNAFATGRTPETASIAVTKGLADKLTRDELQGVVAHEMGHIRNRDILFMTLAGVLVGTIALLCDYFLRSMYFGRGRRGSRRSGGGKGGWVVVVLLVATVVFAILAPVFARLLYMAISRRREYLADATSVELTRYPPGLASALEKISGDKEVLEVANRATAHLYIVNPIKPHEERYKKLTSTHPPLKERIAILRTIATGAAIIDYERARRAIGAGPKKSLVSQKTMHEAEGVELKTGPLGIPVEQGAQGTISRPAGPTKMTPDMLFEKLGPMGTMLASGFLMCACGEKVLVPTSLDKMIVQCAACGSIHNLQAQLDQAKAAAQAASGAGAVPATSGEDYDVEKMAQAADDYSRPGGPGTAGVETKGKVDDSRLKPAGSTGDAPAGKESYDPTGDGGKAVRFSDEEDASPEGTEAPEEGNPFGIAFDADGDPVYPESVVCPHCGEDLKIPDGFKGSRGPCSHCREMIVFFEI